MGKWWERVKRLCFLGLGLLAGTWAGRADAAIYNFARLTANTASIAAQLTVDVTDPGAPGGDVQFEVINALGGVASSIAGIYFEGSTGLFGGAATLTPSGAGVVFAAGGSPPSLPGGGVLYDELRHTADSPAPTKGINPSESLALKFTLSGTTTFADIITAMNAGTLGLGLHVISIGTASKSDSYVTVPPKGGPTVPEPGSVLIWAGLGACAFVVRKMRGQ